MNKYQIVMDEYTAFEKTKEEHKTNISREADTMKKVIDWNAFGTGTNRAPDKDVIIRINKGGHTASGNRYYSLIFRFTDNSIKKIATNMSNILPGMWENRVYFQEVPAGRGKTVVKASEAARPYIVVSIKEDDKQKWEQRCGCYNLIDDADVGLYCIDLTKPIK